MSDDLDFKMERAKLLERARLERHWTKKQLAERAGYDEKTLYNVLSGGEVQAKTIFDFCQALDIAVPVAPTRRVEVAPDHLGGYSRTTYSEYEADYLIYRPSLAKPASIYRYVMTIDWDEVESGFRFVTCYKLDPARPEKAKTHTGPVSISAVTNLVHFVVTFRGSVRLVTVTKMRQADGIMRGSMLTHFEDLNFFRPTVTPIVIKRLDGRDADLARHVRFIDEGDEDWSFARSQLALTETGVLNLCFAACR